MSQRRTKILEVIAVSVTDAIEAEAGGADRLELVRSLEVGGLSPDIQVVLDILAAVSIPVRVMLRENPSMALGSEDELRTLQDQAHRFSKLPIDGFVAGYLTHGALDLITLCRLVECAPEKHVTFHRAFDDLPDPIGAIQALKTVAQVDRILTVGGAGDWRTRLERLQTWQEQGSPQISILAGAGLDESVICDLARDPVITEMHIGRAARQPRENGAPVCRREVARIKELIEGSPV